MPESPSPSSVGTDKVAVDYCLDCGVIRGRQEGICPRGDGYHDWASKYDPAIEPKETK